MSLFSLPRVVVLPLAAGLLWGLLGLSGCATPDSLFDPPAKELAAQRRWLTAAVSQHDVNAIRERVLFGRGEMFSPSVLGEGLVQAAELGDLKVAEILLQSAAPLEGRPTRKKPLTTRTPLMAAAQAGHANMVNYLLGRGARAGSVDQNGLTALHHAAGAAFLPEPRTEGWDTPDRGKLLKALLKAGADPNARDVMGRTPLYYASVAGSAELVRLLLAAGADPVIPDTSGNTPLSAARNASPPSPAVLNLLQTVPPAP
ncbi:MAG: ankyrin repeat domain-containing protein [Nitrospirota bacterium]|nr:ankyrin repeat domain-containing protein [Nitrospirota bacterium]